MKAKKVFMVFVILLLFFHIMAFFVPYGASESVYVAIDEDVENWQHAKFAITSSELNIDNSADFLVYKNKLYLKVQNDESTIIVPVITTEVWDKERLNNLRVSHPELEKYWLNSDADNLGIKWIKMRKLD